MKIALQVLAGQFLSNSNYAKPRKSMLKQIMNTEDFLKHIELTPADIEEARMEVEELRAIFDDFTNQESKFLDAGEYIQRSLGRLPSVHSTRVRVKTPKSLARKVVRKCKENSKRDIRLANYKSEIRDLIGLRAFHLFKDEWKIVHGGILNTWNLHPKEKQPLAYIRRGDDHILQQSFKDAGCKVTEKDAGYRSVHYVLQTHPQKEPYNAEIQVRTLFEEAWGEIDHQVRYPDHENDEILNAYLLILNRLAGGADEMASLLLRIKTEFVLAHSLKEAAEKELSQVKNDFDQLMSELKLTREQKALLQNQFDRIPHIYRQSPEESYSATSEINNFSTVQGRVLALLGGQPAGAFASLLNVTERISEADSAIAREGLALIRQSNRNSK